MSGEVHNSIHPLQRSPQLGIVGHVGFDQFESLGQTTVPIDQTVVNNGFVTRTPQGARSVATDITRSSHYKNCQWIIPLSRLNNPLFDRIERALARRWFAEFRGFLN